MTPPFARKLTILNQGGVYARPSAFIVKTASKFESELLVTTVWSYFGTNRRRLDR